MLANLPTAAEGRRLLAEWKATHRPPCDCGQRHTCSVCRQVCPCDAARLIAAVETILDRHQPDCLCRSCTAILAKVSGGAMTSKPDSPLTDVQVEEFAADPLLTPYTRAANVALIQRIAQAAAEAKRERCAKVAEAFAAKRKREANEYIDYDTSLSLDAEAHGALTVAAAIRETR